jgi:cytochrome c556
MKKIFLTLTASATLVAAVQAHNFDDAKDAIHYRQSAFGLIAYNFGDMAAMLKGKKPMNAEVFTMRAANVAALSKLPREGFVPGSDQGNTEAQSKIWQDMADFDSKMEKFQSNAALLAAAAHKGDINEIKQAFGDTGKSCKGCHDAYKKD